jgi:hypothetical protein
MTNKYMKKYSTSLGKKGNANQNYIKISPNFSQNGYHQKQIATSVGVDAGKKEP